jgi:hypothetical protein
MECPKCKAPSSDDKKYCGECGAVLRKIGDLTDADLRQEIQTILKQELKDQKLVEVEVTEAVVTKLTDWAKLLAYFAGIPIAALLLVLGALGVKKYTDLWALTEAAEKKIEPVVEQAAKQAGVVGRQTEDLRRQSESAQKQLSELQPKLADIRATSERLAGYEKQFDERFAKLATNLDSKVQQIDMSVQDITRVVARPGVERWPVKTGQDPDSARVTGKVQTTVEDLVSLPRPQEIAGQNFNQYQNKRLAPVELTIYTLDATITAVKLETDGDYHMVLQGANGQTMVAEVPTPTVQFLGDSPWLREIALVREAVDKKLLAQSPSPRVLHSRVRITGVGFFDIFHRQLGMAPNGIELHPVIGIQFLD